MALALRGWPSASGPSFEPLLAREALDRAGEPVTTKPSLPQSFRAVLGGEARDALLFTGTNFLKNLGGFLLVPLYWHRLSPADYGVLAVIAVIGSFQQLFGSLAMDLGVTRFFHEWPEAERRRNLGAIWSWNWINTLAWGGLFLLVLPWISRFLFPEVAYYPHLALGILSNCLSGLFVVPASAIRIKRIPWLFALYNLASFTLSTSLGIWFVVIRDRKLTGFLMSTIWSNAAMAALGAAIMLAFSRPCLSSPGLRQTLRFCLPAIPSNLISTVSSVLDRVLLNYFASLETLGLYALSTRFAELISGALHSSLKMAYSPFMLKRIKEDKEHGKAIVASITSYYMLPYFTAALGLCYAIGPFVHLIDRADYFPVVHWVPWFAGLAVLSCFYYYYTNGLFLGNRTDLLSVPAIAQLITLVIACACLIPSFQLAGLVAAQYLTATVFFALNLYLSQKIFPLPHRWHELVFMSIAALGFAALNRFLTLPNPYLELALKLPFGAAFVGVSYAYLRRQRREFATES